VEPPSPITGDALEELLVEGAVVAEADDVVVQAHNGLEDKDEEQEGWVKRGEYS
jgi:hypothetical protein